MKLKLKGGKWLGSQGQTGERKVTITTEDILHVTDSEITIISPGDTIKTFPVERLDAEVDKGQ